MEEDIATFLREDSIGRNSFLNILMNLLSNMPSPSTVALNGKWGSGKTIIARQLEWIGKLEKIETFPDIECEIVDRFRERFIPYYYNAWENDYFSDALQPLLFSLTKNILAKENFRLNCFKKALKGFNVPDFIKNITYDLVDLNGREKGSTVEQMTAEFVTSSKRYDAMSDFFDKVIGSSDKKLLFIVDELDRCNPAFAVKTLECIKHFCSNKNLIFLLPVNNGQLAHTVCHFYGENFSGASYLNRFFDYTFTLGTIDTEDYLNTQLASATNIEKGIAYTFGMTMREINRYALALSIIQGYITGIFIHQSPLERFCRSFIAPLAVAISIARPSESASFNNGKNPKIIEEIIRGHTIPTELTMALDGIFRNGEFISHNVNDDEYGEELLAITQKWYKSALFNTDYDPDLDRGALKNVISLISSYSTIESDGSKENEADGI